MIKDYSQNDIEELRLEFKNNDTVIDIIDTLMYGEPKKDFEAMYIAVADERDDLLYEKEGAEELIEELKSLRKEYLRGCSMDKCGDGEESPIQVKAKALDGIMNIIEDM